ncbi:hypothetical protein GCM10010271_55160 [Streptomyces kurssanovii]|nr:hypothetical protein GCM10010271_55160 [Streptomyces kurssanovii]
MRVERVWSAGGVVRIDARTREWRVACPDCGRESSRVHSRYASLPPRTTQPDHLPDSVPNTINYALTSRIARVRDTGARPLMTEVLYWTRSLRVRRREGKPSRGM